MADEVVAGTTSAEPLALQAQGLTKRFGGLVAVDGAGISVPQRGVVGIIGPNGAGKTTMLNLLSGALRSDAGTIRLAGQDITGLNAPKRAASGLRRTFQNIRLFATMSVLENVVTGMHVQTRGWLLGGIVQSRTVRRAEAEAEERAFAVLEVLGLHGRSHQEAGTLSYGDQRRLEIARALAPSPTLLLLDEPAAGLNSAEKREAAELIARLPDEFGLSVVLVEHDMGLVTRTCAHVSVLEYGRPLCSGTPEEILSDSRVIEAYLGTEHQL